VGSLHSLDRGCERKIAQRENEVRHAWSIAAFPGKRALKRYCGVR
jgi:hypothetical protein